MRNTFIKALECIAGNDPRVVLLTGDLGYGVLNSFAETFPSRYFNMGISEQIMTSAAAGMALEGNVVFTYSIGNFNTLRCMEQIRNDICYHNANVKIVSVGGGFSYGQLGMSHHSTEDIAMMRELPHMRVYVPADPEEAVAALHDAMRHPGPCYFRIAKNGEPKLSEKGADYDISKIHPLRSGSDVCILGCGPLLNQALKAAEYLEERNISAGICSVPCVKPLDVETLEKIAQQYRMLVTVEEHQKAGGLGGAIAEVVSGLNNNAPLLRLGLQDVFTSIVGSHDYLCDKYELSARYIADAIASRMT